MVSRKWWNICFCPCLFFIVQLKIDSKHAAKGPQIRFKPLTPELKHFEGITPLSVLEFMIS